VGDLIFLRDGDRRAAESPVGYTCLDAAGERLGELDGVIADQDTYTPRYLVVRTGGWLSTRSFVLPADEIATLDSDARRVSVKSATRDRLRSGAYPEYGEAWWESHGGAAVEPFEPQRLELLEERLRVTTQQMSAGTVRLRKRVVERQETVVVPIHEEYLVIERGDGEGTVRVGDRELAPGETIELPLIQERVLVTKEPVVYQAVTVRKEIAERRQELQGTVRREELEITGDRNLVIEQGAAPDQYPAAQPEGPRPAASQPLAGAQTPPARGGVRPSGGARP